MLKYEHCLKMQVAKYALQKRGGCTFFWPETMEPHSQRKMAVFNAKLHCTYQGHAGKPNLLRERCIKYCMKFCLILLVWSRPSKKKLSPLSLPLLLPLQSESSVPYFKSTARKGPFPCTATNRGHPVYANCLTLSMWPSNFCCKIYHL